MRQGIRRMDTAILLIALLSAGMAALLFWLAWRASEEDAPAPSPTATASASATLSPTLTPSATYTPSSTHTPTRLPSHTPTRTPSATLTFTVTASPTVTSSPTVTASLTASATPTTSPSVTPSLTATPYPEPQVDPIVLAETYAGEAIRITGRAQASDTIVLLDNGLPLTQAQADQRGNWEINLDEGLAAGDHLLELYAIGPRNQQSVIVPLGFIVNMLPTATASQTPRPSATVTPSPTRIPSEVGEVASPSPSLIVVTQALNNPVSSLHPSQTAQQQDSSPTVTVIFTDIGEVASPSASPTQTFTPTPLPSATPSLTLTFTPLPSDTPSRTFTNTADAELLPSTATNTPSRQAPSPSHTPTLTATASFTASPASPTSNPSPRLMTPRFDAPQNPYSPFAPIQITGQADPNMTILLQLEGELVAEVPSDASGQWAFTWTEGIRSGRMEAVARDSSGRLSGVGQAAFAVELIAPRITRPATGTTILPGTRLEFRGTASANAPLVLQADSLLLGQVTADSEGNWALSLIFDDLSIYDVYARILDTDGLPLAESNLVRVTVAEGLAPDTGGASSPTRSTGQLFSILLAFLLVLGGSILLLMGRLVWRKSAGV